MPVFSKSRPIAFPALNQVGGLNTIPRESILLTSPHKLLDPERIGGTALILILIRFACKDYLGTNRKQAQAPVFY